MKEKHIGQRIKDVRLAKHMTQSQIAIFLGVSIGTIIRLERGEACYDITKAKIERQLKGQEVTA